MKEFQLNQAEIEKLLDIDTLSFPKYATQIINLANQNAQGTRPKVVGQMSELIQEFTGKTVKEWENWYLEKHPDAIENATEKITQMIENFKQVLPKIDSKMIESWVKDLVIVKTFVGLRFQEAILKHIASEEQNDYRLSDPEEEAKGIDGFIGDEPISIKPKTYESKAMLPETINQRIIFYEKVKGGIKVSEVFAHRKLADQSPK